MATVSERLFDEMQNVFGGDDCVPEECVINQLQAKGTAFFPGGDGFYKESGNPAKESYPIMILGNDFDNNDNFNKLLNSKSQSEILNGNGTWRNLIWIFNVLNSNYYNCKVNIDDCFFTNSIMGMREGNSKHFGPNEAKKYPNFLEKNYDFFKFQLDEVQPKMIVSLGSDVRQFLGGFFDYANINTVISGEKNDGLPNNLDVFKNIDRGLTFEERYDLDVDYFPYRGEKIYLVYITHPAIYFPNYKKRSINSEGHFGELFIFAKAYECLKSDEEFQTWTSKIFKNTKALRELFDIYSSEFQETTDEEREQMLKLIVRAGFDLGRVVKGYEQFYKEYKPHVVRALSDGIDYNCNYLCAKYPDEDDLRFDKKSQASNADKVRFLVEKVATLLAVDQTKKD